MPGTRAFAHDTGYVVPLGSSASDSVPLLQTAPVSDADFDGIPTAIEQSGWSNDSGGPYITDPNNPDSDGDGLNDGEEQLYDFNPTDNKDPGMYVLYRDDFQTRKYWPWQQHANRFIVHGGLASYNQDVIVRRGTTLFVGGPPTANLSITKSIGSLTTLSAQRHACGGGWAITIPSNGTVGKYTLTMSDGGWSQTLDLYIIFDIPSNLTDEEVSAYLYSDELSDDRDSNAVWIDTSYDENYSDPGYEYHGRAYAFRTDQYKRYVFEDYVINAINGKSSPDSAFTALAYLGDANTRFDPDYQNYTMYSSLIGGDPEHRNHCSGVATVTLGFMRAAGIPSRVVVADHKYHHYDSATEGYTGNAWITTRAWTSYSETVLSNTIAAGIVGPYSRYQFGHVKYTHGNETLISIIAPDWKWDDVNDGYHCGWGKYTYRDWYKSDEGSEYSGTPPGDVRHVATGWEPVTVPYWGWPSEPTTEGIITQVTPCAPDISLAQSPNGEIVGDRDSVRILPTSLIETQPELNTNFGNVVADYVLDTDGNNLHDTLVIEVEVNVGQPGNYTIVGRLNDSTPTQLTVNGSLATVQKYTYLEAGSQIVKLEFDGRTIYRNGEDGNYTLDELWLTDLEYPEDHVLVDNAIDYQTPAYQTAFYNRNDFENGGAELPLIFSHDASDSEGDGYYDSLTINGNLIVNIPGEYTVMGDLTDEDGNVVASASWTGSDGQIALHFDTALPNTTPYYLRNLYLKNDIGVIDQAGDGNPLEIAGNFAYTTGALYGGIRTMSTGEELQVSGATAVDSDNDGDYDSLDFVVNANILSAGDYEVEAWLESSSGALIAWKNNQLSLPAGFQPLNLSFDGQAINAFRANGPFKLLSLKLSNTFGVLQEVDVAYETQAFTFDDFDGEGSVALLDGIEGSPSTNWNLAETQWGVTQEASHTPIQSWTDSPNVNYAANTTTWLTSNPVSFGGTSSTLPVISFQTCQTIADDVGKVQVRVNGQGNWLDVETYSGSTEGWQFTETVPHQALGAGNMEFRFQFTTNGSNQDDGWYIDDVVVTTSDDIDGDGIANDLEGAQIPADTDGDGTPDFKDADSDNDNIPDADEGSGDTDNDGIPDFKDLDTDGDYIPDVDEGSGDTDGDGTPDFKDSDTDGDSIPDSEEGAGDLDGDNIPDFKDLDTDGDNIPDSEEGADDPDGDGKPNFKDDDADNDTMLDVREWTSSGPLYACNNLGGLDTDLDGVANCLDNDVDGDGIPNFLDTDSDGDGTNDNIEIVNPNTPADNDGDNILDYLDSEDSEANFGAILRFIFLPAVVK